MSTISQRRAVIALIQSVQMRDKTVVEMVAASGLEERAVNGWINAMRQCAPRMVVINDWREDSLGRRIVPAYQWRPGAPDAPKPAPKTRSQITADYRTRKKGQTCPK